MARYQYPVSGVGFTVDQNGKVIQAASVSVFLNGTTTPASIYAAKTGGTAVNSITSDSTNGSFHFFVDSGDYTPSTQKFSIQISKTNYQTLTLNDVSIYLTGGDI
jgi:hypothetical protein